VLLQQFHDILPGSSIAWVHREAEENYARVIGELSGLLDSALSALNARPVRSRARQGAPSTSRLQNGELDVIFDHAGVVRSVRDLAADREVLPPGGAAGLLQLHPDHPIRWDAWDLDRHYRHVVTDLTSTPSVAVEDGAVVVKRSFGESSVVQRFWLEGRSLMAETEVDWHEREKVLKLAFDVDVHTDHARYETQFGHLVRPTHENTSWDAARFEVCAHRWVQVADASYGVALVNDATYGHDVTRHARAGGGTYSRVRASLLRAPRYPDPETDQGRHVFRHALVVGASVLDAVAAGRELNQPAAVRGVDLGPLVNVDGPVVLETLKLAEDGSGDVICRLYEPQGARATATLSLLFEPTTVTEVDLLERPRDGTAWDGDLLSLRPFEIVTLRLVR